MSGFVMAAALFVVGAVGCGKTARVAEPKSETGSHAGMAPMDRTDSSTISGTHPDPMGHTDHTGHDKMSEDMAKMKEGLAGLSPDDRTSAEKQHFCPVSGKMLGTMGTPAKVQVEGQDVWICCPGCEDQLRAKSSEYLAKLNR
jgi:hypothetical protein